VLNKILGKKSHVAILRYLYTSETEGYCLDDITKSIGQSCGTIYPALQELLETRIITQKKIGKSKIYTLNTHHVLYSKIKELIQLEKESLKKIAQEFVSQIPKKYIDSIVLFGSVARGSFTEKSDIDLLIIYNNKQVKDDVYPIIDHFITTHDIHVIPIFLTNQEVKEKLKQFDSFIITLMDEGKVLYGEKPW